MQKASKTLKLTLPFILIIALSMFAIANSPPVIPEISPQTAFVGEEFEYLVKAIDLDDYNISFSSNSTLFNITNLGFIHLIPNESQIGLYSINLTVSDMQYSSSTLMNLTITDEMINDFDFFPKTFRILIKKNQSSDNVFTLINREDKDIEVILDFSNFNIFSEKENIYSLEPYEKKDISVILEKNNLSEGIHTGKIGLKSGTLVRYLPTVIEVESEDKYIDLRTELTGNFKDVSEGEQLIAKFTITRPPHSVNISFNYFIKDFNNLIIYNRSKQLQIFKQISFLENITLPKYLSQGQYVLGAMVAYNGSIGTSSEIFNLGGTPMGEGGVVLSPPSKFYIDSNFLKFMSFILLVFAIFLISVYIQRTFITNIKIKRGYEDYKIAQDTVFTLRKKLESLTNAYRAGYISRESYQKGKKRVDKMMKKNKKRREK